MAVGLVLIFLASFTFGFTQIVLNQLKPLERILISLFYGTPATLIVIVLADAYYRMRFLNKSKTSISNKQVCLQLTVVTVLAISDFIPESFSKVNHPKQFVTWGVFAISMNWLGFLVLTITLIQVADL